MMCQLSMRQVGKDFARLQKECVNYGQRVQNSVFEVDVIMEHS